MNYAMWRFRYWLAHKGMTYDDINVAVESGKLKPGDMPDNSKGGECVWSENSFGFWSACEKNDFQFFEGGPKANGFKYCPFCGKTVVEMPYKEVEG